MLILAAEKLSAENRKLRKQHSNIIEIISGLIHTDLIRDSSKWKEAMAKIREIIASTYPDGSVSQATLSWRNYLDAQIYKALDYQYRLGLYTITETLPDIKVDLVFKNQKLQFSPSFEEIQVKYYKELRRFINIPVAFAGLGEGSIFKQIVEKNAKSLEYVFQEAQSLFKNLLKVSEDIFGNLRR